MASRSINKAQIMGNLTADPVMRTTQNGTSVSTFAIATNRSYTDSEGARQEVADYHNIVAFGKLAEICVDLLQKGSKVLIEGRLQTRKWDDESGKTNYKTEIVADDMYLLARGKRGDSDYDDSNSSNSSGTSSNDDDGSYISADDVEVEKPKEDSNKKESKKETKAKDEIVSEDDIPF